MAHLTVASIDEMACTFPYLLGFVPEESVVLVFADEGGVVLTARIDLVDATREAMDHLVSAAAAGHPTEVFVGVYSQGPLPVPDVIAYLGTLIPVRDAMHLRDGRRTSYLCPGHCCQSVPVDPAAGAVVAAKFGARGIRPAGSRADLAAEIAPSGVTVRFADGSDTDVRLASPGRSREDARDEYIGSITAALQADDLEDVLGPSGAALLASALADIRIRDTVLWDVASMDVARRGRAVDALRYLARCAPQGRGAPVLAMAAVGAYLGGDGARARVAVDAALGVDPGYSLALLVEVSLQAGVPPRSVARLFTEVSRERCRMGMGSDGHEEG
jgi:hypothetical protein